MTDVLDIGDMFSLESYSDTDTKEYTIPVLNQITFNLVTIRDTARLEEIKHSLESYQGIDRSTAKELINILPVMRFNKENYYTTHISKTHYKEALEDLSEGIKTISNDDLWSAIDTLKEYTNGNYQDKLKRDIVQEYDQFKNVVAILDKLSLSKEDDYSDYTLYQLNYSTITDTVDKTIDNKRYLLDNKVISPIIVNYDPLTSDNIIKEISTDVYPELIKIVDYSFDRLKDILSMLDEDNLGYLHLANYLIDILNGVYKVLSSRKTILTLLYNQYSNQDK